MLETKWAIYNSVQPPTIDSNFFSPSAQAQEINYNPVAQAYFNSITLPTANDTVEQEVAEPVEVVAVENKKKIKKKKQKAAEIAETKSTTRTKMTFDSQQEFVNTMDFLYKKELNRRGLDTRLSSMLVAQDAHETAWGKKVLGKYNYGNITTNGNDWTKRTGKRKWKDFKSIDDYISYKIDFLSNKRYQFFTYADANNIISSMQNLANRGYDPGNSQYGSRIAGTFKNVLKYLNNA